MIQNDAEILQHSIEEWTKEIKDYVSKIADKMISRQLLPVRKVGADVGIDQVTTYDRTGAGAKIVAKGARAEGSGSVASNVSHEIYQLLDKFYIHEKDIKHDPKLKNRNVQIILGNIHRAENDLVVNGDTNHNISGIVDAARANTNGLIDETETTGDWDGSDTSRDIYNDTLLGLSMIDGDYDARFLLMNKIDSRYMFAKDSEGVPYWKSVCSLFGKTPQDPIDSWLIKADTSVLAQGYVYLCAYDPDVAELVISENPTLRAIALQEGGNYPIEMYEWLVPEFHNNQAFAEIHITGHA